MRSQEFWEIAASELHPSNIESALWQRPKAIVYGTFNYPAGRNFYTVMVGALIAGDKWTDDPLIKILSAPDHQAEGYYEHDSYKKNTELTDTGIYVAKGAKILTAPHTEIPMVMDLGISLDDQNASYVAEGRARYPVTVARLFIADTSRAFIEKYWES
jgi:hypothetical protein